MKNILLSALFLSFGVSCTTTDKGDTASDKDSGELEKVKNLELKDKHDEDSVLAHWQKKMEDAKLGDE